MTPVTRSTTSSSLCQSRATGSIPLPGAEHVRTGLHRASGETTNPAERSLVFIRDRLRASRGVKSLTTGQRFFEGFEAFHALALHALRRGHTRLTHPTQLLPGYDPALATVQECVRAVARTVASLGACLTKDAIRTACPPVTRHCRRLYSGSGDGSGGQWQQRLVALACSSPAHVLVGCTPRPPTPGCTPPPPLPHPSTSRTPPEYQT